MKITGKILFFNSSVGTGIIITIEKEKYDFSINSWNDFDVMPQTGLEVVFDYLDENVDNIVSIDTYEA